MDIGFFRGFYIDSCGADFLYIVFPHNIIFRAFKPHGKYYGVAAHFSKTGKRQPSWGTLYTEISCSATKASEKYFGDSGDTIRHSRHYHRYYEGYTEVRTPNPKNKFVPYKIERVYTAPYTVADMERNAYLRHMVFYGLLTAAVIFLYISAFTDRAVAMNASRQFGAAAVMVTLVPLVLLTASLIAYYLRPKKMKSYDYRTTTRNLKATAIAAATGFLAAAALLGAYLCVTGSVDPAAELLYAARLLLASAACFALYRLERRMPYRQEPNNVKLPEGEYHRIQ